MNAPQRRPSAAPTFEVVFADQARFAWRLLIRLGVSNRDAADVCQEVFLVVHRRLPQFEATRSSLRSWVYGICIRAASEYRRRNPARHEVYDHEHGSMIAAVGQDDSLEAKRAWLKLERALDAMDSDKRQVFVLYELENVSMAEICQILGCPVQTAYSRLHAARRLILAAFQPGDGS